MNKERQKLKKPPVKITENKRYRLSVYRSLKNFYAQVIDDDLSQTLVQANSLNYGGSLREKGEKVAHDLLLLCQERKIKKLYLDRGRLRYQGTLKKMIEILREGKINI